MSREKEELSLKDSASFCLPRGEEGLERSQHPPPVVTNPATHLRAQLFFFFYTATVPRASFMYAGHAHFVYLSVVCGAQGIFIIVCVCASASGDYICTTGSVEKEGPPA